jgi:hypothetical protein
MTLLPIERPGDPGPDPRLAEVQGYSWSSLARALDALTDEELITRLKASEVGRAIAERLPPADAAAELARLAAKFASYGRAASESFARRSRVWTCALGFLLAFALNIDTFNLLARYMADPSLAESILAHPQAILAAPPQDDTAPTGPAADALTEAQRLVIDASRTVAGLSTTFPIGWTLYPNCAGTAGDPRCLALRDRMPAPPPAAPKFWSFLSFLGVVGDVARADPAGFLRWLAGIVVTGALLGLGTPFWVEVLNNFLRARSLIASFRNVATASDGEVDATPPTTPAPAPAGTPARRLV